MVDELIDAVDRDAGGLVALKIYESLKPVTAAIDGVAAAPVRRSSWPPTSALLPIRHV